MYIERPISFRNPKTRTLLLAQIFAVLAMAAMTVIMFVMEIKVAKLVLMMVLVWLLIGWIPCMLLFLQSYVTAEDGQLVRVVCGVIRSRIPRGTYDHAISAGGRLQLYQQSKAAFSIQDSPEVRRILNSAHIRIEESDF